MALNWSRSREIARLRAISSFHGPVWHGGRQLTSREGGGGARYLVWSPGLGYSSGVMTASFRAARTQLFNYTSACLQPSSESDTGVLEGLRQRPRTAPLADILSSRDGFVAFGRLIFRATSDVITGDGSLRGILSWNRASTWTEGYPDLLPATWFACDHFGVQFGIARDGRVLALDPETGVVETAATSLGRWLELQVGTRGNGPRADLEFHWEAANGSLGIGERLVPEVAFILGGEVSVANLRVYEETMAMRLCAQHAAAVRRLAPYLGDLEPAVADRVRGVHGRLEAQRAGARGQTVG